MSKLKYEAVATIGEYKNHSGETKKRYLRVGTVFENDEGRLSLKLDAVPVGSEWSGWVSFYEPKDREPQQRRPRTQRDTDQAWAREDKAAEEQDDIPF